MSYPRPVQTLIDAFKLLPGVGPRTAERYAFGFLQRSQPERQSFLDALGDVAQVQYCTQCHNFSERALCALCSDPRRNASIVCVVADPQDLGALERTGDFKGVYHILGGLLTPLEGITPDDLRIQQLLKRVSPTSSADTPKVTEVILAFDQTPEGESTSIYLAKILKEAGVRVTRLGRGLPTGSDLNYADAMTLSSALTGRKEI